MTQAGSFMLLLGSLVAVRSSDAKALEAAVPTYCMEGEGWCLRADPSPVAFAGGGAEPSISGEGWSAIPNHFCVWYGEMRCETCCPANPYNVCSQSGWYITGFEGEFGECGGSSEQ